MGISVKKYWCLCVIEEGGGQWPNIGVQLWVTDEKRLGNTYLNKPDKVYAANDEEVEKQLSCGSRQHLLKLRNRYSNSWRKTAPRTEQDRQCDNANLKSNRRCNNMSCMDLSGYVRHMTVFSWMFTIACCLVVGLRLGLGFGTHWKSLPPAVINCYPLSLSLYFQIQT